MAACAHDGRNFSDLLTTGLLVPAHLELTQKHLAWGSMMVVTVLGSEGVTLVIGLALSLVM